MINNTTKTLYQGIYIMDGFNKEYLTKEKTYGRIDQVYNRVARLLIKLLTPMNLSDVLIYDRSAHDFYINVLNHL